MNSDEFCGGDAGQPAGRWGKNSVDRRSVSRLAALLLLLVAVIAGCAGQPAEPVTGTLVLGAAGLPEGAEATATISGPAELNTTVQLPGSIALQAGDYTVSAHDLTHGSVRYVAAPTASQVTVAAGQDRTVTFTYAAEETGPGPQDPGAEDPGGEDPGGEDPGDDDSEDDDDEQQPPLPARGNLIVNFTGLPAAVTPQALVRGPADFENVPTTATTTYSEVLAGTYTVQVWNVLDGADVYQPEGSSVIQIPVVADETSEVTISYAPLLSRLELTIIGTDGSGDVMISGPGGYSERVSGPTSLVDLRPGEYVIAGLDFLSPADRFFAAAPAETVSVPAGANVSHEVVYSELTGTLRLVTNTSDDAAISGSLPHRLAEAALDPDIERIVFRPQSFPGSGPHVISVGATLNLTTDVMVIGLKDDTGAPAVVLQAAGPNFQLFDVAAGAQVELRDLVLRDAQTASDGGAVMNRGDLTLRNVTVRDNTAGFGGGIYNNTGAILTLHGSSITDNSAANQGGGVANLGTTAMYGSQVTENSSVGNGGGILNMNAAASLVLTGSEVSANTSGGQGGGIHSVAGSIELVGSLVAGNSAETGAGISSSGELLLEGDSKLANNVAVARGGGIFIDAASPPAALSITRTVISGNSADLGAGIWNGSTLELTNSVVTANQAGRSGGGIYSAAGSTLKVSASEISANRAENDAAEDMQGGGIRSLGELTLDATTVSGNSARFGGGLAITDGTARVKDSVIEENEAVTGGGIYKVAADLWISHSIIRNNLLIPSATEAAAANDLGNGAGVFNSQGGTLLIEYSSISGNTTPLEINGAPVLTAGGGIHSARSVNIADSTISDNRASAGAGIHVVDGGLNLSRSTVSGNIGRLNGGGIFANTHLAIVNSTITGNSAMRGGGVMVSSGSQARISYSTISGNSVQRNHATQALGGGGLYVIGQLHMTGTIAAGNTMEAGGLGADIRVNNGTATSFGYNLIGSLTDSGFTAVASDGHSLPAGLLPLADNGGPTWTMLPESDSFAVNNGHAVECQDTLGQQIRYDQRSTLRAQDGHCTIGAVELND